MNIPVKYFHEINGQRNGISSTAMLCALLDIENTNPHGNTTPCDPSDFGRCLQLLERCPELRKNLSRLEKFEEWRPFIKQWPQLERLYYEECPTGRAPRLYEIIKKLNSPSTQERSK